MFNPKFFCRLIYNGPLPKLTQNFRNTAYNRLFNMHSPHCSIDSRKFGGYESDGKTVGFIINKRGSKTLFIEKVMVEGFFLTTGGFLVGSMIIFPHSLLHWNVTRVEEVTEESLTLFKILDPKIDILILGYGLRKDYTPEIREHFTKCCKKLGIMFEALPTDQAAGTFNILAEERRLVAGALIPPSEIDKLKIDRSIALPDDKLDDDEEELSAIESGFKDPRLLK